MHCSGQGDSTWVGQAAMRDQAAQAHAEPKPGHRGGHASSWVVLGCRRDLARGGSAPWTGTMPQTISSVHKAPGTGQARTQRRMGLGLSCECTGGGPERRGNPGGRQGHGRRSQTPFYSLTLFFMYFSSWVVNTKVTAPALLPWMLSLSYDMAECKNQRAQTSGDGSTAAPTCTHAVDQQWATESGAWTGRDVAEP